MNEINHNHTVFIWGTVGCQVMALFRQIIKRIQAADNLTALTSLKNSRSMVKEEVGEKQLHPNNGSKTASSRQISELSSMLNHEELELLKAAVKFVFLTSLVTCYLKKSMTEDAEAATTARSINESVERKAREELAEREACAERRGMRRGLVEEGVFPLMGALVTLNDDHIKVRGDL